MANTTIKQTGLANAEGSFGGGLPPALDAGNYLLELATYEAREKRMDADDEDSSITGTSHIFRTTVVEAEEGLEQQKDGSDSFGRTFVHVIFVPTEDHPSYSQKWWERTLKELKAMLDGFQIKVSKSDNFDATKSYGLKAWAEVTQYTPKNETEPRNGIRSLRPEE